MLRKITYIFDDDDGDTENKGTDDAPIGYISSLALRKVEALQGEKKRQGVRMTERLEQRFCQGALSPTSHIVLAH